MCTIFYLNDDKNAFGGNNEDFNDPHTKIWFVPREGGEINGVPWVAGKYARNYCGYRDLSTQGGMNEKGLFFDFTATPPLKLENQGGMKQFNENAIDYIFSECATVAEVLELLNVYDLGEETRGCMFIGDATGDSAIVEGEAIIRKNSHFQVSTNFYQSQIEDPSEISCGRFKIATEMLANAADDVSVDTVRSVLSAVRQAGGSHTVYSQVYDLKKQIIHLYHFHNFDCVRVIDPREEWAKGEPVIYDIAELFPPTYAHISYAKKYDFEQSGERKKLVEKKRAIGEIIALDASILNHYVGRYECDIYPSLYLNVIRMGDRLVAEQGGMIMDLYPTSTTCFYIIDHIGERKVSFESNKEARVTRLICELFARNWPIPYSKMEVKHND
ncbi:MAG: hypothetical protein JRH15_17960 [Deltaproteobacteria bacterium]|nr:hypothetical protein [Deltaproteobacteria bacterium]